MEKKKYTLLENIRFYFANVREGRPNQMLYMVINIIASVLVAVITSVLPTVLVTLLTQGKPLNELSLPILGLSLALGVITFIALRAATRTSVGAISVRVGHLSKQIYAKFLNMDFEMTEDEAIHKKYHRALDNGVGSNPNGGEAMYIQSERLLINVLTLLVFGLFLTTFNPLAFALTLVVGLLNAYLLGAKSKFRDKTRPEWSVIDTKRLQLKRDAIKAENGKDARIYDVQKIYAKKVDDLTEERLSYIKKEANIDLRNRTISTFALLARDLFVYTFLIKAVMDGTMNIAAFTLFFTIMGSFNKWIDEIVDAVHLIRIASQDINDVRAYLDIVDKTTGIPVKKADSYTIAFNNVSYKYPNATKNTLTNLSFTMDANESIALVGINGAGKSTIVKLLLGLVHPTEGTITLNGEDITKYDSKSYFELFAPAFQENDLWALTLAQNITMDRDENIDEARIMTLLDKVGLSDVFKTLPNGIHSNMTNNIHLDGTNLSGGQTQKLMLARALYKDAPIIVLDEPTAALDAIAEQNMYEQYSEFTNAKSSLFISHRLSSTRFCDRIIFLEHGQIVEEGSHTQLMAKDGAYAEMYAVQSQYYQKEEQHEEIIPNL